MTHRLVVNTKHSACDVYVGRGTRWGNPYKGSSRRHNILAFERYIRENNGLMAACKNELRGKVLGCHCAPKDCHADILARIANDE
jgi:Domain of unknown function (DUF4326)